MKQIAALFMPVLMLGLFIALASVIEILTNLIYSACQQVCRWVKRWGTLTSEQQAGVVTLIYLALFAIVGILITFYELRRAR